ncbi:MAG: PHP domain-containing protein [Candidatus Coprovivens sp.]
MEKRVDLHTHSIYSDGSKTPKEVSEEAKRNNVGILALTDHDNIDGSKELIALHDPKIYVYSGVELTAKVNKGRLHILGYNIDLENEELNKRLKEMHEASIYNILLYVELLKKDYGITIPQQKLDWLLNLKGNVGRPQLALILIELGYAKDVQDAFDKFLIAVYDKVRHIKKGLTKEEAIPLIVNAGGVASLAHPSTLKLSRDELKKELLIMKSLGLQCIEIIHSNETPETRRLHLELAKELGLMISGGTDYHGHEIKPDIDLGYGRNENVTIYEKDLSLVKNIKSRYM